MSAETVKKQLETVPRQLICLIPALFLANKVSIEIYAAKRLILQRLSQSEYGHFESFPLAPPKAMV